jgi:hypothetical protein
MDGLLLACDEHPGCAASAAVLVRSSTDASVVLHGALARHRSSARAREHERLRSMDVKPVTLSLGVLTQASLLWQGSSAATLSFNTVEPGI